MSQTSPFYQPLLEDHHATQIRLAQFRLHLSPQVNRKLLATEFAALTTELDEHFWCEEKGLFPILSQYRTMVLMDVEHDQLQAIQRQLEAELAPERHAQPVTPAFIALFDQFEETLQAHMREEEQGVFPLADSVLEPEEKLLSARKLREAREAYRDHLLRGDRLTLERPSAGYRLQPSPLFQEPHKPIIYKKLFEADHASLHHLYLQAGQGLKKHMSAEHQCLTLISGDITLATDDSSISLTPGQQAILDPQCAFSIDAHADSHLLLMKVWPRPHFIRR